ncbi:hypothetical protein EK21DRAFT_103818 [Setomelanomma holmii]|uniref:AIG1-type G domain-containing protein n=1 Tax=Setomelanomma holmii TaxID=210430 RepID=A0A9P4H1L6_9PLEO|nr:hypothetical protein EK21DRAFT_103818 [Setomelanomma holmii]
MILVMGVTGSGKSYFVNKVAASAVMEGARLRAETEECQVVLVGVGCHEVGIVDTPGFDDTTKSDAEVLNEIVKFLCTQYRLDISLKGIIYLHRITDIRITGSARRYFEMFQCLCGARNFKNVVLLTTMWSELRDEATDLQRERELRKDFWMTMERGGSTVRKFEGTRTEAEAIICRLMREPDVTLEIQYELVDEEKRLEDTLAGKWMVPKIECAIGESEGELQKLEVLIEEAEDGDKSDLRELKRERERILDRQRRSLAQLSERVDETKKKDKWKSRLALFGTLLGVAITVTVNIILPLAGVSLLAI